MALDNLITGSRTISSIFRATRSSNFASWMSRGTSTSDGPVDCVMHLASLASPKDYLDHPIETLESGSTGTRNMLDLALLHKATFLLTSTSECYGDPLEHPQRETYWGNVNPVGPALLLRREQALRRSHHDGVSPHVRTADQYRAHLQYLRPADAAERRPRRAGLHRSGASMASR